MQLASARGETKRQKLPSVFALGDGVKVGTYYTGVWSMCSGYFIRQSLVGIVEAIGILSGTEYTVSSAIFTRVAAVAMALLGVLRVVASGEACTAGKQGGIL